MVLNLEDNVSEVCRFDSYYLKQERSYSEGKNSMDDEGSPDLDDLLPPDPFGMEFNISLPSDPFSMDINFSLPRDPFGMDFSLEATVAAINGFIEDIGLKTCGLEDDKASVDDNCDSEYVTEFNFILAPIDDEERNAMVNGGSVVCSEDESCSGDDAVSHETDDFMLFGAEKYQVDNIRSCNSIDDVRYTGLDYALYHLGVGDLLRVESVCKSLCNSVRGDLILWNNIAIVYPWSNVISDDDILRLTNRAQGNLHSLSLVKCLKITDSGLRRVLDANPHLTKLSVAGCIKITGEHVLDHVKAFNSVARPGIKKLRVGHIRGLNEQLVKEFKLLLGADEKTESNIYKPRYYRGGELHLSLDDERAIDIETCPRCHNPREVYDCPEESCQDKINSSNPCRGCIYCIARCICCGCCLENRAFEETFVLELLCLQCFAQIWNQQGQVYIITKTEG